jgi:5-methyltetrahydropteroyltriglutamate--homocysteine methyltransferase
VIGRRRQLCPAIEAIADIANRGVCRSEATYEGTADPLFNSLPRDRFLRRERRGGRLVQCASLPAEGQVIVLGLISTKTPVLESEEELLGRIDETSTSISSR